MLVLLTAPLAFVHLAMGGLHHGNRTLVLHTRLRYFDPERRRPGLPPDVAALVESMTGDETVVTLVNVSPVHARRVIVQAGAYGEHEFTTATADASRCMTGMPATTGKTQQWHPRIPSQMSSPSRR